jgi:hypothetical protein
VSGQRSRLKPAVLVQFAEMRDGLLNHPPSDAHAPHQAPVAVNLAVFLANRVAQIHAPSPPQKSQKKIPLVGTTCPNLPLPPRNPLIPLNATGQ